MSDCGAMVLLSSAAGAGAAQHAQPHGGWVTVLFAVILTAMIVALALEERIAAKKSVITGWFAVVSLLLATALDLLPFDRSDGPLHGIAWVENVFGETVRLPVYIPAIDWSVIAIILGSSLFVDVVSKSGLFTWIAIKLTKASRGDPLWLLVYYSVMTVLFSALLNNVTAMLIVGSLTAVSLDRLGRSNALLGFLLVEGLLTNVGGLLTLISSVPNIIVGSIAGIEFVEFFLMAAPYVVVATIATIVLGARRFGVKRLVNAEQRERARELVAGFDENDGIEHRGFFWTASALFVLFIVTLATTSVLPFVRELGMGYVALGFAFAILARYKSTVDRFYQALDWDLILFFGSLFVVINVMEHAGVLGAIGRGLELSVLSMGRAATSGLLAASAAASAVTDNIPLSAMLAKIVARLPEMAPGAAEAGRSDGLWWAIVFGANLGGNLTPIGSASTVVAVTVMARHGLHVGFMRFVRLAAPFALLHITLAVLYLMLRGTW